MSQYRAKGEKGRTYVYGFDRPLQEYFLTIATPRGNHFSLVGSLGSIYGSGINLLEVLKKRKVVVPQEHVRAMEMDLPF